MKNAILSALFIASILLTACPLEDDESGGGVAAPTNLTAVASSPTSISLNWTAVSGAAKYKVYTSVTSTGVYRYVDETEHNTYVVNDLVPDSTYYYKVSSVDVSGIEGPLSVYAQGTTPPPPDYIITFDVNGGNGTPPPAQTASAGSAITLPSGSGLSRTGYNFGGWNTSTAGTGIPYSAGSSYTVLGSITLYAMWYDPNSIPSYTVTFNANGGSGTPPAPITQNFGTSFNLPNGSGLTRSGYTFGGWSTSQVSGMGTIYNAGSSYTISGNITLYALWNAGGIETGIEPPGLTLADKFAWLQGNAQTGNEYNIVLSSDQTLSPQTLSYMDSGRNNIIIRLRGSNSRRIISFSSSSSGAMFTIGAGVTLDLGSNITLQGRNSNSYPMVRVNTFGTLIMNEGSIITGNSNSSSNGGGVYVGENGIFLMNGGTISSNRAEVFDLTYGGGVCVSGGTFTMNSGTISGNTSSSSYSYASCGGGVSVNNGTFTMNGGNIFGNTTSSRYSSGSYGGGIYVGRNGTFNMNGGTISSNTATSTSTSTSYYGGGVYVSGMFAKTGGIIYGYTSTDSNSNVVSSGTVSFRGHAVYAYYTSSIWKGKDTTAGTGVNLSFNGETGESSGDWDF
jgi:uncharacterized repeat protein (TIGR02543 family)